MIHQLQAWHAVPGDLGPAANTAAECHVEDVQQASQKVPWQ